MLSYVATLVLSFLCWKVGFTAFLPHTVLVREVMGNSQRFLPQKGCEVNVGQ